MHVPPRTIRIAALVVGVLVCGAAIAQDADSLLAQAREALSRGDDSTAIGITSRILEEFAPDDSRALLARSLAHYRSGDLTLAEADLTAALESTSRESDSATDFRWPNDFMSWVASVRAAYAPDVDLPDIALDELNVEVPTRSVSAHFVMNVEVVRIPVIVEGWERNAGFMTGLTAEDFSVVDGSGPAQPIRALIPEHEPTSIGVILDAGPGTEEIAPPVIDAVSKLLEALRPEDEIFIAQYGGETRFLSDFSTDRIALAAALSGYSSGPGRAMRDAIATGLIRMRSAQHEKKALIVIANGDDEGSQTTDEDILVAARREGVAVHALVMIPKAQRWRPTFSDTLSAEAAEAVAAEAEAAEAVAAEEGAAAETGTESEESTEATIAEDAPPAAPPTGDVPPGNAGLLQEIAHNTGGLVALRPPIEGPYGGLDGWIEIACRDVSDYINNQYLVLFRSTDPPERGTWRPLRVRVEPRHSRIRARSGYVR